MPGEKIVSYCATFLKPEMLHVYRQVSGVRSFRNIVVTRRLENHRRFPHAPVIELKKSPFRFFQRLWHRSQGERVPVADHEISQLSRIVRREAVGLVHIYFGTEAARLSRWLPQASVPIIVSFHGADVSQSISDGELKVVFENAALILHRSDSLREELISRGAPISKLRANPTGVPVPAESSGIQIDSGKPLYLLQACRFIEKKGLDVSLEATKTLLDLGFDARLTLAGDGPLRGDLESLADQLGIASRIRWTGFLTPEQLAEEYERTAIFLHPSRETSSGDREGIPNSLLEAMAHGRVVLGTRHSGIPEAVENGVNGLLVDHADAGLVAEAIGLLARNSSQAQTMATAARQSVIDRFSTGACISQLESCYREAIGHG